jgi:glycogen synthase
VTVKAVRNRTNGPAQRRAAGQVLPGCRPAPPAGPRRILMTADTAGGVWTYALELAQALAAYDVEVALAIMGGPLSPLQRQEANALPNLTCYESHFKLEWMAEPWPDVARAGAWLLDLEDRTRPDLVHLNAYAHGALPWRAPTLVVGHSCVLSWWTAVKGEAAPQEWQRYRQEVQRGLQAAHLVAAPTGAMLAALHRHYGPLPASQVIANGRSPHLFAPQKKDPFIFACGRLWDEAKNVGALDAVALDLAWPIYIAGDARSSQGQTAYFTNATCLGQLSPQALQPWFGRAAIYALPARYEPFGLSILEAALAGCALVLGDIPSLREVWQETAVYVPPDDSGALQWALSNLIRDEERRRALAGQARQRALRFTPDRMARAYLAAYERLPPPVARQGVSTEFT